MQKLKTKFKPFIHITRGARNYGLFDAENLEFYQLTPQDNLDALQEDLKNGGLTFETAGVVPFKLEPRESGGRQRHLVLTRRGFFEKLSNQTN